MTETDILIIGGGIAGASTPYHLAESGHHVTLLERGEIASEASGVEVLLFLHALPIKRTWAGLMPFPLDGAPIIGKIPPRPNLYIDSGLASSGFGRGPMAGKLLADYIHTGHRPHVLAEADPGRCVTLVE